MSSTDNFNKRWGGGDNTGSTPPTTDQGGGGWLQDAWGQVDDTIGGWIGRVPPANVNVDQAHVTLDPTIKIGGALLLLLLAYKALK